MYQVDIMLAHFKEYGEGIQSKLSPEPIHEGRNWQEFSNWYNRSMYHLPE